MTQLTLTLVSTLWLTVGCQRYDYGHYAPPRVVDTKQGRVQGTVRTLPELDPVEVYLGIPYAAAPVGSQRFMPPASPPPWPGTRIADTFGPVCPQSFPSRPDRSMPGPTGRWGHMDRVRHALTNQSEDCLYLNIYAPLRDQYSRRSPSLPVIVFIHGESFEWNSGNLYDGSVLASYGNVVVVTFNYRLGILGFLKPGVSDHVPSNFGLFDQVAALEWIRGNIEHFGGDKYNVTLMGHGTGAACVSYLMISPLAQSDGTKGSLFKRAILMSGTALADWALTSNPVQVTIQVAQALNCPNSPDAMAECLRRKRLHELTSVNVHVPSFKTRFGPVVDGQVIPNEPSLILSEYSNLFKQYDLMSGLTEMESYFLLNDVDVVHGMVENDFYEKLDEFLNAKFEKHPELAKSKTIYYYRTWEKSSTLSAAESHRNTLLEILSDARVAAPLVKTLDYHVEDGRTFFYVFKHLTQHADFHPWIQQSVQGEELPFVFGVPLDARGLNYDNSYSPQEKLLSEVIMTLWTNFAKTGDPNTPPIHQKNFQNMGHRDWMKYYLTWPEYDRVYQQYYSIQIPPTIEQYYRQRQMVFWNQDLPFSLNNSHMPYRPTTPSWLPPVDDNVDLHRPPLGTDTNNPPPPRTIYPPPITVVPHNEPPVGGVPSEDKDTQSPNTNLNAMASSVTLSIVILVGICFLLVNMCAFIGLYYQRDKLKVRERIVNTRYRCVNVSKEEDDGDDHYVKTETQPDTEERSRNTKNIEIKSILKSSDGVYEQVKNPSGKTASVGKVGKRMGISRQASSSTVTIDPHTKVKEWIAQEIVQRCSPRFLRRTKKPDLKTESCDTYVDQLDQMSNKTLDSNTSKMGSLTTLQRQKVKKVSVAIDATPATRSASVLQQTPIELTKSMDEGLVLSGLSQSPEQENLKTATSLMTILKRPSLQRSDALNSDESVTDKFEPLRRSTSINVQLSSTSDNVPKISHFHSLSDPLASTHLPSKLVDIRLSPEKGACDVLYSQVQKRPKPPQVNPLRHKDVNVTSRDDLNADVELSAEEALDSIRRRNYPKVLPDYPDEEDFHLQKASKRRSLPLSNQLSTDPGGTDEDSQRDLLLALKVPPPPPPRVSTLGRKPSNSSHATSPFTSSQLTVKLKSSDKSHVPLAVRSPPVQSTVSPERPKASTEDPPPPASQIKRLEPRVIIKPTMNPITSKKEVKPGTSNIPRVTPPQPSTFGSSKDLSSRLPVTSATSTSKYPDMGMGRKTKITPVKKTVSTETALDANVTNTGTIKRLNK